MHHWKITDSNGKVYITKEKYSDFREVLKCEEEMYESLANGELIGERI